MIKLYLPRQCYLNFYKHVTMCPHKRDYGTHCICFRCWSWTVLWTEHRNYWHLFSKTKSTCQRNNFLSLFYGGFLFSATNEILPGLLRITGYPSHLRRIIVSYHRSSNSLSAARILRNSKKIVFETTHSSSGQTFRTGNTNCWQHSRVCGSRV